jgi:phosphoglycerate kinase
VQFAPGCAGPEVEKMVAGLKNGDVLLLENLRFHAEEEKNDPGFAKQLAALCDVYVNDAFGTANRAHASTAGIAAFVKQAAAGFLMQKEIESLHHVMTKAEKPYVAIVGGAKISDKIELIENFINIANTILIGGAMAYTFLRADGLDIG